MNKYIIKSTLSFSYIFLLICLSIFQGCNNPLGSAGSLFSFSKNQSANPPSESSQANSSSTPISLFAANLVGGVNLEPSALFNNATGLAIDSKGNIFVMDKGNFKIRKITPTGLVSTFAGTGIYGSSDDTGAAASFSNLNGITIDSSDNLYVTDYFIPGEQTYGAVRKITPAGVVTTYAYKTGARPSFTVVPSLTNPVGLVLDSARNLYVADSSNDTIIQITPGGVSTLYASNGGGGFNIPTTGAPATGLTSIAIDSSNTIYAAYSSVAGAGPDVYSITQSGTVTLLASPVPAFQSISALAVDNQGNVYATDPTSNNTVLITKSGSVFTSATGLTGNGITFDTAGNVYFANNTTINKIATGGTPSLTGIVTTIAGVDAVTGSTDNSGASSQVANFNFGNYTGDLAVDSVGNIYAADVINNSVRKITPAGEVNTIANGSASSFSNLKGIGIDSSSGIIYITANNAVLSITPAGLVTPFAGGVAFSNNLGGIAVDSSHNVYVADIGNAVLFRIDGVSKVVTPIPSAGSVPIKIAIDSSNIPNILYVTTLNDTIVKITDPNGTPVATPYAGSSSGYLDTTLPALKTTAQFHNMEGITIDTAGNMYIADQGNYAIRKIDTAGNVTTLAGTSTASLIPTQGLANGIGTAASFTAPAGLTYSHTDNCLYVTDAGTVIRKITLTGVANVTTLAGVANVPGSTDAIYPTAKFITQGGMTKALDGGLYVVDTFHHQILKVSADGKTSNIIAGSGVAGNKDDVGKAATFRYPQGITMDSSGSLYVTDTFNHTIRKIVVDPATQLGAVSTFAGGVALNDYNDAVGTNARFNYPQGISIDNATPQNLYVADGYNHRIRKITTAQTVTPTGTIIPAATVTTITGQATAGYDDGSATNAKFGYLKNFLLDGNNNAYLLDSGNNVIRMISNFLGANAMVGTLLSLTPVKNSSSSIASKYSSNISLGSDKNGNVYISDYDNSLIKRINANGGGTTIVAGTIGTAAFTTETTLPGTLLNPSSIYVDPDGAYLYVLENNSIVKISLPH